MKIVKYIFVGIILFFLYIVFTETNYYKLKRACNQLETDLNITLFQKPKFITYKDYGWAEEGGDLTLLKLDKKDCLLISNLLNKNRYNNSMCMELFNKNGIYPKESKTLFEINKLGDSKEYLLDINRCVLCIHYHFE